MSFLHIARNALFHHEAVNGKGYPFGLKRSDIPVESRIIAVADVYDAISEKRSYNIIGSSDMALWVLQEGREKKFDAVICDHFFSFKK